VIQAMEYGLGSSLGMTEKGWHTLLRWMLKSPSSMVQTVSTHAKEEGHIRIGLAFLGRLPFTLPFCAWLRVVRSL